MRIVHIASEVVPISKTGGLADVAGALPAAQAALGHEVTVITPAYRLPGAGEPPGTPRGEVRALGRAAGIRELSHEGVLILGLDCPELYARPALYSLPDAEFSDNAVRFAFLARAALEVVGLRGGADIVHAHDWQAALALFYLRHDQGLAGWVGHPRTLLAIHNLAYQGVFPPSQLDLCELPHWAFTPRWLEFFGQVNFLKAGIVAADAITTVSPTYAREILTPDQGWHLEGLLATRVDALHGIINGLDVTVWNPANDPALPRPYDVDSVAAGKLAARVALASELGIGVGGRTLIGMVSRLAGQKGADLIAAAVDDLVADGFDLMVLGSGERRYESALRGAERAHPGRVRIVLRMDEPLAHRVYAASDLFLMPSRYEPCGLGQMIAMRYGALPVARRTGGLVDTVTNADRPDGTGFLFDDLVPYALLGTLSWARTMLADPDRLAALRRNAMTRDFTWAASARRYLEVYSGLLGR
jgi:starch synthase